MKLITLISIALLSLSSVFSYATIHDPTLSSTDDTLDLDILDDIVVKPSDCKDKHNCVEELCREITIVPKFMGKVLIIGYFTKSKCEIVLRNEAFLLIPGLKTKYKQSELKDLMEDLWEGGDSDSWRQSYSQCGFLHEIKHATQTYCETGAFNKNEKEGFLEQASCLTHHADKFEEGSKDSEILWDGAFEMLIKAHYNECLEVFDLPSLKDCEACATQHILGKREIDPEAEREFIKGIHKAYCPAVKFGYACVEEEE